MRSEPSQIIFIWLTITTNSRNQSHNLLQAVHRRVVQSITSTDGKLTVPPFAANSTFDNTDEQQRACESLCCMQK